MNALYGQTMPNHLMSELAMYLRNTGSTLTVAEAATKALRAWMAADAPSDLAAQEPGPVQGYQWKVLFLPSGTDVRLSTREATYHARVVGDYLMFEGRRYSPRGFTLHIAGSGRNAWRDLWLRMPGERYFLPASRRRREQERVAAGLPANPAAELRKHQMAALAARVAEHSAPGEGCAQTEHEGAGEIATTPAIEEASVAASVPSSMPSTAPSSAATSVAKSAASSTATHTIVSDAEAVAAAAATMSEALKTMLALMERLSACAMPNDDRRVNPARREDDILAGACVMD